MDEKTPVGDVVKKAIEIFKAADEQRLSETWARQHEAEHWKSEGDMYGWNFHQGMASGNTNASIIFFRVLRFLEKQQKAIAAFPPRCETCSSISCQDVYHSGETCLPPSAEEIDAVSPLLQRIEKLEETLREVQESCPHDGTRGRGTQEVCARCGFVVYDCTGPEPKMLG